MIISRRIVLFIIGCLISISGLVLVSGWFDSGLSQSIAAAISRRASPNWPSYFRISGWLLVILGLALLNLPLIISVGQRLITTLRGSLVSADNWLEKKFGGLINLTTARVLKWPLSFNINDWIAIIFFILVALIYQVSMSNQGFPTVILGGDAANIASFAAGRAYPSLFSGDAILGDLRNIGLYVTIHLPITIWLEKLFGNFGLAYSVLLFPHVFLQYFSYYLLGRVVFNHRYWAFLFTLVVSAPLEFAGGEVWGAVGDGMPRFTFQVLIPFLLILLLSVWRDRPQRWSWIMLMAGLMAFIHPVSTPTWAFALWLGLWPCMPSAFDLRQKLLTMLKTGLILGLALLPYVSIYLSYHQGGRTNSNYDLVYFILTNYFPYDLLNIPAALKTLLGSTSEHGLLWYGLAGLGLTFLLFRTERSRLNQFLTWMAGIAFITILIPFVEQTIERALRIIPLQTELMRGMRYLVPFLFIFWFYPLAELTRRVLRPGLVYIVLLVGTLSTTGWLIANPPLPFTAAPDVLRCWFGKQLFCPTNTDYAAALGYIRTETPQNAKFVVFLTNRWSGIEVRYLGLRPMAYAYKDRGQLAFTNLEALQTWFYYLQRENAIFSRNISPTLDLQQVRMIDFAMDAEANYLLTDFSFPPDVLKKLGVTSVYQNNTFSILRIYNMRK